MCSSVTAINVVYLKLSQKEDPKCSHHVHQKGYMDMLISLIWLIIL